MAEPDNCLSLSLLETGIFFVDHIKLAFAANDLAIGTPFFDRSSDFHIVLINILFVPENDSSSCQIVWTHLNTNLISWQDADIMHTHFPRNSRQYFVTVFQLYPEHRIRKRFYNDSVLFDQGLFGHTVFGSAKISGLALKKKNRSGKLRGSPQKRPDFQPSGLNRLFERHFCHLQVQIL
jgi:hypothetical protein